MAGWKLSGTYLEFCSCDPGCGCNFKGSPNSAEGNCQALLAHRIEDGAFDGLDLSGSQVAWGPLVAGCHPRGRRPRACLRGLRFGRAVRSARPDLARGGGLLVLRDLQLDLRGAVRGRPRLGRAHGLREELAHLDRWDR